MTEGQRRVVGWIVMAGLGLLFWLVVWLLAHADDYQRNTRTVVWFESSQNVRSMCAMLIGEPRDACANSEEIIAPNPCLYAGDAYAWLLCHELGHVNGAPPEISERRNNVRR